MDIKSEDIEQCFQSIDENFIVSEREEYLLKQINEIENQKEVLLEEKKILFQKLTKKQQIIENCFEVLKNYKQMFSALNSICFCNKIEINFVINNMIAINDSLYQQNRDLAEKSNPILSENILNEKIDRKPDLLSDETHIKSEPIDNTQRLNDRFFNILTQNYNQINDKKSVETQVEDNDLDFNNSLNYNFKEIQTTGNGKPDLMSSVDSEDSDMDRECDGKLDKNFGSKSVKNTIKEKKSHELPNDEICVKAIELKKLDFTENKGKDYVDEILLSEDFLKCPENCNQINDKSEKPLIIGNFANKTEEEKLDIKRKLLQNKCLVKKSEENLISLSVPRIRFNTETPFRSLVLIGYECPYTGCDYRCLGKYTINTHIGLVHKKIKNFDCDWPGCDAKFYLKSEMASHYRTHTGEKPYLCDWPECGVSYKRSSSLKTHKMNHKGVKPYCCPRNGCEMSFVANKYLKKHIICHEKGSTKCSCCVNSDKINNK